MKFVVDDDDDD